MDRLLSSASFVAHNDPADLDAALPDPIGADFAESDLDRNLLHLLIDAGLRPTRQRMVLSGLLFAKGNRHVTAEMLYSEACGAGVSLAQATVYNTLNQFTQAGLLRRIGLDGSRSFFDTNTTPHGHYYLHGEGVLLDIPEADLLLERLPDALPGHEVSRVDLVIHLRRKMAT